MRSLRVLSRASFGLIAALLVAPAARALQITGLSVAPTGTNSASSLVNNGQTFSQIASSTSITIAPGGAVPDTIGQSVSFQTRYAALVAEDRDSNGSAQTSNMTSNYSITFTVSNPAGTTYQLTIDTLRAGALTIVGDDAGAGSDATASIGAVTGSVDAIVNGSLALAAFGPFTSTNTGMSAFSQNSTSLTLTSSALTHTYTLNFGWTSGATSNNDEAAVRMGSAGGITNTTAEDYPGAGGLARTQANDGHFVTVATTIIATPEPAPGALLAFGLLGLALRARLRAD